ncbi:MAG TPA: dihydrofolate reductase family protein [Stackebrandtia sp.]|jgi:dihydrofolate reductase|uniref:dihydrofolate reductase family protein n=1 Tax=Stackebrandtia sp. TaxID=2023065 RepID=UPI002D25C780|nr:dihydrofolate reductase family protein [Stackebrandtia sp.]HZE41173.1 dihydrofolate reductase family protein [Stackebrandtia sp.]
MGRLVTNTMITVDGVYQAPGGPQEDTSGGFASGGWFAPYVEESIGGELLARHLAVEVFLYGRHTYEILGHHWPHAADDDPMAAKLNHSPKYVVSRTLTSADWENSTLLPGDVAEEVRALKRRHDGDIFVIGSGMLVRTLLRHDLVDRLTLIVAPVIVGEGKRLFAQDTPPRGLRLVGSKVFDGGIAVNDYEFAGAVKTGDASIAPD